MVTDAGRTGLANEDPGATGGEREIGGVRERPKRTDVSVDVDTGRAGDGGDVACADEAGCARFESVVAATGLRRSGGQVGAIMGGFDDDDPPSAACGGRERGVGEASATGRPVGTSVGGA